MSATFWNEGGGQAWVELQDLMDRLNQPISEVLVAQAGSADVRRVLDVGCGAGATTLDMARRLGPDGVCIGVDVSGPLLAAARQKARSEDVTNVDFIQGDAQSHAFDAEAFDAVISRFGVMFFEDFDAAFANLLRAVRPGGKLVFACWRSPAENPLSQAPLEAAAPFLPSAAPRPPREGPGRWAFADPDKVRGILERSGWRQIEIAPLDAPTPLSFDELMRLSLQLGSLGPMLGQASAAVRTQVRDAVAARMQPFVDGDGRVGMTAACWLVTARR